MPRAKGGPKTRRRHKKTMKAAKGYVGGRRKTYRQARETVERGLTYAYRDRKQRKRDFRGLWITRINAAARQHGLSYSRLVAGLKAAGVDGRPQDPRGAGARRRAGVRGARRPGQDPPAARRRSLQAELARLRGAAEAEIAAAESAESLEAIRVRYLGRKGSLNAILRGLGQLPPEERPAMGALANAVKDAVAAALDAKAETARAAPASQRALAEERIDVTLPGRRRPARTPPPAAADRGRPGRHLRLHGILRRRGTAGRGRLPQLRRPELPARPSRARRAGHLLPRGRRRSPAAHPHLAGPAARDAQHAAADPRGHAGHVLPARRSRSRRTRRCSSRSRGCWSTSA